MSHRRQSWGHAKPTVCGDNTRPIFGSADRDGGRAFGYSKGSISVMTRRSTLLLAAGAAICATTGSRAAEERIVTVHKDPSCGCCSGWVAHLQQAGFIVRAIETADLDPVKTQVWRAQRSGGLPHSANRGLRHRGPRSRRRAQAVPQRHLGAFLGLGSRLQCDL